MAQCQVSIILTMDIQLEENETKGEFYVEMNGNRVAKMTFTKAGPRIIIDHTEVSDILKGQNAGKQLVGAVVRYAREHQIKVLPLCPFAKSVFQKVKEYQDVLD